LHAIIIQVQIESGDTPWSTTFSLARTRALY